MPGSALGATADGSSTTTSDVSSLEAAAPSYEAVGEPGTAAYTQGRCAGYAEIEPATAVVFVVVALLIGLICYHALAWIPVPYTALLLVFGAVIGIINEAGAHWNILAQGICLWENIDPNLLLAVFLPVLLFASSFAAHWHTVRRQKVPILLLAFPGVLLGTGAIAVLMRYSFPYGWTWTQSLLFGAMMAATDPVATVAVLGDCGASEQLRILIEGESLVNDGSASVVFFLMQAWVEGKSQTVQDAVRISIQLSVGGAAWGLAVGLAATLWLRFMFENTDAEITLTIVAAFGVYIVGDELLNVSGLLGIVALGTWLAAKGRHRISSNVNKPMRVVWAELEYIANTLIFVLAGVIIAGRIWNSEHTSDSLIQPKDYGYAFLLWVYLQVVRLAAVVLMWPLLTRFGYGLKWREGVVLVWAGLRGAVGLSLSLFVLLDNSIEDLRYRTLSFFFMGMMAGVTLVVQGSTTGLLLRVLGLTKPQGERRHFLNQMFRSMDKDLSAEIATARNTPHTLGGPDWFKVKQLSQLDTDTLLKRYGSAGGMLSSPHADFAAHLARASQALQVQQRQKSQKAVLAADKRRRLLLAARASVLELEFFQKADDVYHLIAAMDKAMDYVDAPLCDWGLLQRRLAVPSWEQVLYRLLHKVPLTAALGEALLAGRLAAALERASAFVLTHEAAARDLRRYESLEEDDEGEDGAMGTVAAAQREAARNSATNQVLQESAQERAAAEAFMAGVRQAYPEVAASVRTTQLAHRLLAHKARFVEELSRTGLVEETEAVQLEHLLEQRTKRLYFQAPRPSPELPSRLAALHPALAPLPPPALRALLHRAMLRVCHAGDVVQTGDGPPQGPLLLVRGTLCLEPAAAPSKDKGFEEEDAKSRSATARSVSAVALLGVPAVQLSSASRPAVRMTAATFAVAYQLRADAFEAAMAVDESAAEAARRAALAETLLLWGGPLMRLRPLAQAAELVASGHLERLAKGTELPPSAGPVLLVAGAVCSASAGHVYQNGGRRSISGSSAEWLRKPQQAVGAAPQDGPQGAPDELQDTVELIVVPHPNTSPTAADVPQLLRQQQAQQPVAKMRLDADGQESVLNGSATSDGHAEAWLGRGLPAAAGDSPSGSSSELAGSSEDGGGELSAPRMLDPSQAHGCISAVVILRLAPVDTWPPVDLHEEGEGGAAGAGLQPDRSAWSRRHAALRRISEMALDDSQLELDRGDSLPGLEERTTQSP